MAKPVMVKNLEDRAVWADWFTMRALSWTPIRHEMTELVDSISNKPLFFNTQNPTQQYFLYFVVLEKSSAHRYSISFQDRYTVE